MSTFPGCILGPLLDGTLSNRGYLPAACSSLVVQQGPRSLAVARQRLRQARGRQGFRVPGHARAGCPESGPGHAGRAAGGLRVLQHDPGQPVFRLLALAPRREAVVTRWSIGKDGRQRVHVGVQEECLGEPARDETYSGALAQVSQL